MGIRYYKFKVNLYLFNNFLVEVFVNHKKGIIEKIQLVGKKNKRMNFYADQIKIPELFQLGH